MLALPYRRALLGPPAWTKPNCVADFDFAGNRAWSQAGGNMASLIATSRASTGYGRTAAGLYVPFAANTNRITDAGLTIEPARTNLTIQAADLTNAAWSNSGGVGSGVTGGQADPAGGSTAILYNEGTGSAARTFSGTAVTVVSGTTYTKYLVFKAGTGNFVQLRFNNTGFNTSSYANFNIASGVVTQTGGNVTTSGSGVTAVGGGWYLCWASAAALSNTSTIAQSFAPIPTATNGYNPTYTGTGLNFYVWGAEFDAGAGAYSPILTTAAVATRAADAAQLQVIGIGRMVFTFADGSQQTITGIDKTAKYTFPTILNQPVIARATGYAA